MNKPVDKRARRVEPSGTMKNEIKEGSNAKVDLAIVKRADSMPPYLRLVRQAIKGGEGTVYVSEAANGFAYIRAHRFDLLGDIRVPLESLTLA